MPHIIFLPQPGKARACGNLGNAYSALGQYGDALKYYQLSLVVAKDGNNIIGQGQACFYRYLMSDSILKAFYCLGTTYTMMRNFPKAIENYEAHLRVATDVNDTQGQGLSNIHRCAC